MVCSANRSTWFVLPRMMLSSDFNGRRDCDLRDVYASAEVFVDKLRQAGERTEDSCGNFIQRTIRAQWGQARNQNGFSGPEFRQFALGVTNGFFFEALK